LPWLRDDAITNVENLKNPSSRTRSDF